jgi:hypothetical protein
MGASSTTLARIIRRPLADDPPSTLDLRLPPSKSIQPQPRPDRTDNALIENLSQSTPIRSSRIGAYGFGWGVTTTGGGVSRKRGAATAGQFNVRRENDRTLSRGAGLLLPQFSAKTTRTKQNPLGKTTGELTCHARSSPPDMPRTPPRSLSKPHTHVDLNTCICGSARALVRAAACCCWVSGLEGAWPPRLFWSARNTTHELAAHTRLDGSTYCLID